MIQCSIFKIDFFISETDYIFCCLMNLWLASSSMIFSLIVLDLFAIIAELFRSNDYLPVLNANYSNLSMTFR